ncbi:MAG: adenosylcobinamide-phosphate synthase CbiB [Halanaeroarchaeum sp.]
MAPGATIAIALAFALDLSVQEPPERFHPVAHLGAILEWVEERADETALEETRSSLTAGILLAALAPLGYGLVFAVPVAMVAQFAPWAGGLVAGVGLFTAISLSMLLDTARAVVETSDTRPTDATDQVTALVGRDPEPLSPAQLRSAALESAAENLADGFLAPLSAFVAGALFSLPAGIGLAAWVKAVNTLDSTFGYRDRPVGTASARLDDAVQWVPARLTAGLIALVAGSPGSLMVARKEATAPPSPNSGWPMATLAHVLGVSLQKPGAYRLNEDASLPTVGDGYRGIELVGWAGLLAVGISGGILVW